MLTKKYLKAAFAKQFIPLRHLSAGDLTHAIKQSPLSIKACHTILFEHNEVTDYYWYLVKGQLNIDTNGYCTALHADTEAAHFPFLAPTDCQKSVTAASKVILLRVHRRHLQPLFTLKSAEENKAIQSLDEATEQLFQQLYDDYDSGKLALPSLPDMAFRIRQAMQSDKCNAKSVARIIQIDPAITARLLQIVNSPLYRGQEKIVTCESAVTRLGLESTKTFVTAFTLQQLFHSESSDLQDQMQQLWQHSAEVSAMSYILAKTTKGFDPDFAMLAGLLHDIGTLAILAQAEQYQLLESETRLQTAIYRLNNRIGAMLIKKWNFDDALVTVARESELWMRDLNPEADYCDIVLLAQLHSYIGTKQMMALPVISEVPAFQKIALGKLSPQRSLLVLDKAKEQVEHIKQLLGASH